MPIYEIYINPYMKHTAGFNVTTFKAIDENIYKT